MNFQLVVILALVTVASASPSPLFYRYSGVKGGYVQEPIAKQIVRPVVNRPVAFSAVKGGSVVAPVAPAQVPEPDFYQELTHQTAQSSGVAAQSAIAQTVSGSALSGVKGASAAVYAPAPLASHAAVQSTGSFSAVKGAAPVYTATEPAFAPQTSMVQSSDLAQSASAASDSAFSAQSAQSASAASDSAFSAQSAQSTGPIAAAPVKGYAQSASASDSALTAQSTLASASSGAVKGSAALVHEPSYLAQSSLAQSELAQTSAPIVASAAKGAQEFGSSSLSSSVAQAPVATAQVAQLVSDAAQKSA